MLLFGPACDFPVAMVSLVQRKFGCGAAVALVAAFAGRVGRELTACVVPRPQAPIHRAKALLPSKPQERRQSSEQVMRTVQKPRCSPAKGVFVLKYWRRSRNWIPILRPLANAARHITSPCPAPIMCSPVHKICSGMGSCQSGSARQNCRSGHWLVAVSSYSTPTEFRALAASTTTVWRPPLRY